MRDIRLDLRERIDAEKAKRLPLQQQLDRIDANVDGLTKLLAQEEARVASEGAGISYRYRTIAHTAVPENLQDFLLKTIKKGSPKTLDELRDAAKAAGFFPENMEGSPGRKVHGALLNPVNSGQLIKDEAGRYSFPETETKEKNPGMLIPGFS